MNLNETFVKAKNKTVSVAKNAKDAIVDTVKEHPGEIMLGVLGLTSIVIPGIHIGRCLKENRVFQESVRKLYGSNVTEGNYFAEDPHKLWGMRRNWEEIGKSNFDKAKEFIGELKLTPGESFTLQKVGMGKHKGKIEVFQSLGNGFFHDEII